MFKFRYTRSDTPGPEGVSQLREGELYFSIEAFASQYLSQDDFPLAVWILDPFGGVKWKYDQLWELHWCNYLDAYDSEFVVTTSGGRRLFDWKFDAIRDGDIPYQVFTMWARANVGARGIAIGVNDGTCGEWVNSILSGNLRGVLCEPTAASFEKLSGNWAWRPGVDLDQVVVSDCGGEVIFYEGQHSVCNSLVFEHSSGYSGDVQGIKYNSVTPAQLIEKWQVSGKWWLHLDCEGYDDKIIKALPVDNLPDIIVFEHCNFSQSVKDDLISYLESLGYFTQLSFMNGVSQKKKI